MKRHIILTVAALASMSMLGPVAMAQQDLKVLLIVKEDSSADLELMLTKEVGVMTEMLEQAGFEVVVASASGQPLVAGQTTLTPDLKLADVNVADYAGFIMPCMAVGFEVPLLPEVAAIVQGAVAEGKPVAAQVGSVITLAEAGVLSGKKYALIEEWAAEQSVLEDAIYSGNGIVQDGKIITSGVCPYAARALGLQDGTPGLTQALIAELTGGN